MLSVRNKGGEKNSGDLETQKSSHVGQLEPSNKATSGTQVPESGHEQAQSEPS